MSAATRPSMARPTAGCEHCILRERMFPRRRNGDSNCLPGGEKAPADRLSVFGRAQSGRFGQAFGRFGSGLSARRETDRSRRKAGSSGPARATPAAGYPTGIGRRWYSGGRQRCRPPFSIPANTRPTCAGASRKGKAGRMILPASPAPSGKLEDQAKLTAVRRLRICTPTRQRPPTIIAQVAGSGTAGGAVIESVAPWMLPASSGLSSQR